MNKNFEHQNQVELPRNSDKTAKNLSLNADYMYASFFKMIENDYFLTYHRDEKKIVVVKIE